MFKDIVKINPGDLSMPPIKKIDPARRVLVLDNTALCVSHGKFDEVVTLPGSRFSEQDERVVISETTLNY